MSLWKAIEHGKEYRKINRCHDGCSCEYCCMGRVSKYIRQAPIDNDGNIIGSDRLIRKVKALKNGVTKNYKG